MKGLDEHGFTQPQLETVFDLLSSLNTYMNTPTESGRVEALQVFKDRKGNFYSSYFFHGVRGGERVSQTEYFQIDREGNKIDLSTVYNQKSDIAHKLTNIRFISL